MRLAQLILLAVITTINGVLCGPILNSCLTVSSSGPSDLLGKSVALYPSGISSTGISVVADGVVGGYSWARSSSANSYAGLRVFDTTLGTSYTKALWVKFDSITTNEFQNFMSSVYPTVGSDETGGHFFCVGNAGDVYAGHNVASGVSTRWACSDGAGMLPANQWIHIAVTYDGSSGNFQFYRNGTASGLPCGWNVNSDNQSKVNWAGSSLNTVIGNWEVFGLKGRVQDAQQYQTALTSAQIQQIYQQPPTA